MAVELAAGLERDLGQPVSVMQILSAGSLAAIAELGMKMLRVSEDGDDQAPVLPTWNNRGVLQEVRV
jgi:hypothetical protein